MILALIASMPGLATAVLTDLVISPLQSRFVCLCSHSLLLVLHLVMV